MKYFGIPKCPYCKKRINLIRVWRLKKHGEYICPRCKGISNIYHSPLIYALALLCCAAAFLIFFIEKYITNTVDLTTVLKVFLPFVLFYFLSLFMIYLEKPVIRKVFKRDDGKMVDENGEVVNIAVSTIMASGGKKFKNNVKNPANAEVIDMVNTPVSFRNDSEMIRRPKGTVRNSENVSEKPIERVRRVPSAATPNPMAKNVNNTDLNKEVKKNAVAKAPTVKEEKRNETKYTDEELNRLQKAADSGVRENGQKTIRSRYKSESEFDEIFGGTQEISDRRLKSAKLKNYEPVPEVKKPSEVKINKDENINKPEIKEEAAKKEAPKRFREL